MRVPANCKLTKFTKKNETLAEFVVFLSPYLGCIRILLGETKISTRCHGCCGPFLGSSPPSVETTVTHAAAAVQR